MDYGFCYTYCMLQSWNKIDLSVRKTLKLIVLLAEKEVVGYPENVLKVRVFNKIELFVDWKSQYLIFRYQAHHLTHFSLVFFFSIKGLGWGGGTNIHRYSLFSNHAWRCTRLVQMQGIFHCFRAFKSEILHVYSLTWQILKQLFPSMSVPSKIYSHRRFAAPVEYIPLFTSTSGNNC